MGNFKPSKKQAPPAYMVSFCDMMTLILTFFILLVSMAKEQNAGLVARGVGSFIVAIKTHGLDGIMSGKEKAEIFEHVRRKFNLPPEEDPERRTEYVEASSLELIKSRLIDSLEPHDELHYPSVAQFSPDSAELTPGALAYLEQLAPSLQPKYSQLLLIEGHADDAASAYFGNNVLLATDRAHVLREYLLEEYGFNPDRVEARAYLVELEEGGQSNQSADIRLVTPVSR
jgi:chemotaxis protein MotB